MAQDADAIIFQNNTTFCIDIAEALRHPGDASRCSSRSTRPTSSRISTTALDPIDPLLYRFNREPFAKSPSIDPLINKLSYMVQTAQQTYWDLPRDRLRRVARAQAQEDAAASHRSRAASR